MSKSSPKNILAVGASHVTRWISDIATGNLPPMPNMTIWGEGGIALFSRRMKETIARHAENVDRIYLFVPDFRFGNRYLKEHGGFSEELFTDGYAMLDRTAISQENDQKLFDNGMNILAYYANNYGDKIRFIFWCLNVREHINRKSDTYMVDGNYRHPVWNHDDVINRFQQHTLDISLLNRNMPSYIIDQQGHPSIKAQAFLYHLFQTENPENAYRLVEDNYLRTISPLFIENEQATPEQSTPMSGTRVMAGKDGWLFLDNDTNRVVDQHSGHRPLTAMELEVWEQVLAERQKRMKQAGVQLLSFVAPNKHSVYEEFLDGVPALAERRPVRQLQERLGHAHEFIYPLHELREYKHKGRLYDKTDTHWNALGAWAGYQALCKRLGETCPIKILADNDLVFEESPLVGDLGNKFDPPRESSTIRATVRTPASRLVYCNHINNRGHMQIFENRNRRLPRCVIFGDSFSGAILPFLRESFSRLVYVYGNTIDYGLVLREQADIVIMQSVERFLTRVSPDFDAIDTGEIISSKLRDEPAEQLEAIRNKLINAVTTRPDCPEARHHLGLVLAATGSFERAATEQQRACELAPNWPSPYKYLSIAQFRMGQFDKAEVTQRKALELYPHLNVDLLVQDERLLEDLIARKPDWAWAWHILGRAKSTQGQHAEAESAYRKAIELDPGFALPCYRLGVMLSKQKSTAEAAPLLHRATVGNPLLSDAWYELGAAMMCMGHLQDAENALHNAVKVQPALVRAYTNLGIVLFRQKRLSEAGKMLQHALTLNPKSPVSHHHHGLVLAAQGRLDEAAQAQQCAVSLKPDMAAGYYQLGLALAQLGKHHEAEMAYRKIIGLQSGDYAACVQLGIALFRQGRFADAEHWQRRAITINPQPAVAYEHLALALEHQGRAEEARNTQVDLRKAS